MTLGNYRLEVCTEALQSQTTSARRPSQRSTVAGRRTRRCTSSVQQTQTLRHAEVFTRFPLAISRCVQNAFDSFQFMSHVFCVFFRGNQLVKRGWLGLFLLVVLSPQPWYVQFNLDFVADDDSSEETVKKLPYLQRFNPIKQRARPESGAITPQAKTDCTAINFASVSKCCRTPLGDVFTVAEMTSCNGKVSDDSVFTWVRDYNENQILKHKTIAQGSTTCVLEPLVLFQCIRRVVPEFCPDGSLDHLPLCSKDKEILKKCTPEKIRGNSTQARRLVSTPGCLLDPAEIAHCVYKHFPQNCLDGQQKILPDCGGKNKMEFSRCLGGMSATIATNNEHRVFLNTTNENVYRARVKRKWTTNPRG
ncbi:hypothetical protein B566_EDAN012287 [Ephemera danica]|nr:hypothetical protein B566_EDAN012287 [Ephemera danica]